MDLAKDGIPMLLLDAIVVAAADNKRAVRHSRRLRKKFAVTHWHDRVIVAVHDEHRAGHGADHGRVVKRVDAGDGEAVRLCRHPQARGKRRNQHQAANAADGLGGRGQVGCNSRAEGAAVKHDTRWREPAGTDQIVVCCLHIRVEEALRWLEAPARHCSSRAQAIGRRGHVDTFSDASVAAAATTRAVAPRPGGRGVSTAGRGPRVSRQAGMGGEARAAGGAATWPPPAAFPVGRPIVCRPRPAGQPKAAIVKHQTVYVERVGQLRRVLGGDAEILSVGVTEQHRVGGGRRRPGGRWRRLPVGGGGARGAAGLVAKVDGRQHGTVGGGAEPQERLVGGERFRHVARRGADEKELPVGAIIGGRRGRVVDVAGVGRAHGSGGVAVADGGDERGRREGPHATGARRPAAQGRHGTSGVASRCGRFPVQWGARNKQGRATAPAGVGGDHAGAARRHASPAVTPQREPHKARTCTHPRNPPPHLPTVPYPLSVPLNPARRGTPPTRRVVNRGRAGRARTAVRALSRRRGAGGGGWGGGQRQTHTQPRLSPTTSTASASPRVGARGQHPRGRHAPPPPECRKRVAAQQRPEVDSCAAKVARAPSGGGRKQRVLR